jgi:hypothetical protein
MRRSDRSGPEERVRGIEREASQKVVKAKITCRFSQPASAGAGIRRYSLANLSVDIAQQLQASQQLFLP